MQYLTEREWEVVEIIKISFRSMFSTWQASLLPPLLASVAYASYSILLGQKMVEEMKSMDLESMDGFTNMMLSLGSESLIGFAVFSILLSITMLFPLRAAAQNMGLESGPFGPQAVQLVIGSLLAMLLIFIGLILCFFPGFFLVIALFLFPGALVVENVGFAPSFSLSFRTFTVRKGKMVALALLVMVACGVLYILLGIPAMVYYQMGLSQSIESGNPEAAFEIMGTYMILQSLNYVLVTPLATALTAHVSVLAYANFRNFFPAGPEF